MAAEFTESSSLDKLHELQSEQRDIDDAKRLIPSAQHYSRLSSSLSELQGSYNSLQRSIASKLAEIELQQHKARQRLSALCGEPQADISLRIVNVQSSTIEFQVDSPTHTADIELVMVTPTQEHTVIKRGVEVAVGETNITIEKPETAGHFEFYLQRNQMRVSNAELWAFTPTSNR